MQEPTQTEPSPSITITLPPFLVRWYRRLPTSTWRAAILLFAIGVGIGSGALAVRESIQWYRNRPLPQLPDRKWSEFQFPKYGLRAKLSTEWDGTANKLHYKLAIMPSDVANPEEFLNRFAIAQHNLGMAQVTLNLYDKRHFVVQSSDEYLLLFTSVSDKDGKTRLFLRQGDLYLSREQYAGLSGWDLSVSGLSPASHNAGGGTVLER